MKTFFNLFGMAAAGILGYMIEPELRVQLTGIRPSTVEMNQDKRILIQLPGGTAPLDLATIAPDQLPEMISVRTTVNLTEATSGVTLNIPAGNQVKLYRIEGGNAVIGQSNGTYMGLVPVTETDLLTQIAQNPPGSKPPLKAPPLKAPPIAKPSKNATSIPAIEEPLPEAAPEEIIPEKAVAAAPRLDIDAPAPMTSLADPEPDVAPIPAAKLPPTEPAGTNDVVKAMQQSISSGQIKEFVASQVSNWKPEADEIFEGVNYQVGVVSYKAETIFGVKTIQAKALIKDGSVDRWIWPKSGMQIK